jgi:fumarate reductase flavoprotein subunit
MKKILLSTMAALCAAALLCGCGELGLYNAGTYTATGDGYAGAVTVEVQFDSDAILSVLVTEHSETPGFGDRAIEEIPKRIVEAQTLEVDAVTSATITCDAIKDAVRKCILQAERK